MTRALILETTDAVARVTGYITLALALLWFAAPAQAETYLHAGAWSHHVGSSYDYNETHKLLAVEHNGYIVGRFDNSYGEDTYFAGLNLQSQFAEDWRAGWLVGAMHGYRDCKGAHAPDQSRKLCPMIAPAVTYTQYRVEPSVMVMGSAVVLSVRWGLY